jgi:thioredoxin-dependent peroxiredoxin
MSTLAELGTNSPEVCLMATNGEMLNIKDHRGKWVVLYFYPKDNTPGCTTEAIEFSDALKDFHDLNTVILGVSPDSIESHQKFTDKHGLDITLLSDPDHSIMESFKAWTLRKMYGKEYMGVKRSTFLIDPKGRIAHIWPNVKVKGHVAEVMEKLKELQCDPL